jgi:hypothetical protein
MNRDFWWRQKCRIYADKLKATLDTGKRTKRVQAEVLAVALELDKASKMFKDEQAHKYLCDLDFVVEAGEFPPAAAKIITKCTT